MQTEKSPEKEQPPETTLEVQGQKIRVIAQEPPNIAEIKKVLVPVDGETVYSFGDSLYVGQDGDVFLPADIVAHEMVHCERQGWSREGAQEWWGRYLIDPAFRLKEEVLAYGAQMKYWREKKIDANELARKIHELAIFLSSDSYGNIISTQRAVLLIHKQSRV